MSLLNLESLMNKSLGKNFSEEKNNFEKSIDTLYNSNLSDEDLLLLNDNAFNNNKSSSDKLLSYKVSIDFYRMKICYY